MAMMRVPTVTVPVPPSSPVADPKPRRRSVPAVLAAIALAFAAVPTPQVRARARTALRHWRVKGAVQKALSVTPGGAQLHLALQRTIGGLASFGRECDTKVDDWALMMGHLRSANVDVAGARMLEIGTGWYPTFPVCMYLAGAARVVTVDLERHLEPDLTRRMIARLARHLPRIAEAAGLPAREVWARYEPLAPALACGATLRAATAGCIEYLAPADATAVRLPSRTLDVVFSNSVLEHVPQPVIASMFAEARRLLKPGGVMFHSVNCGDHYAYTDPSIDQLNYLRYSDEEWARWNNAFLYQNRLRAIDFTNLARAAGFAVEIDTSRASAARLAQLARIPVHPRFDHYPREQLAITSIDFVARAPA